MNMRWVCCLIALAACGGCGRGTEADKGVAQQTHFADIHDAAGAGNVAAVQRFLRRGVNINALCSHGESPLHHAVKGGRKDTAALLIANGADINIASARGDDTPLHYAVMWQNWDLVGLFLKNGAREDKTNAEGVTPRAYCVKQGVVATYDRIAEESGNLKIKKEGTTGNAD